MNNKKTKLKGHEFNGKYYPKIKRIVTAKRKKIRSKFREFLLLNLETFIETLPIIQPISKRSSGINPSF